MAKRFPIGIILFIVSIIFGIILFLKSPLFAVSLTSEESYLEIGTAPSQNPKDYLSGANWCVSLSYVDTSNVQKTKTGRYPISIYHGFQTYKSYVNVIDTTPPILSCDIKNKTVRTGETVSVHTLGLKVEDYSEIESIAFTKLSSTHFYTGLSEEEMTDIKKAYADGLDMYAEEFKFSYGGIYALTIQARDEFHNFSELTLTITVEEPPVITAPNHIYAASGQKINFLDYIDAWDFIDEDFDKNAVVIDDSEINLNSSGEYNVYYTATDSYGLSITAYSIVHILSEESLQELINTHIISIDKDIIIGASNAYDIGYYENKTLPEIQELMLPCVVHIENEKLDTFGSGFIIEITDEFVTIVTNEHVIHSSLVVDVSFFDGSLRTGSVTASNPSEDIAFIRIPISKEETTSSLTSEEVKSFRTVHINKAYWDSLPNDSGTDFCYSCINPDGSTWLLVEGKILEKMVRRDWNEYKNIPETILSTDPFSGSSGSALFDEKGQLLGMVRGYTDYEDYTETVAVPLERILKYFEKTFKYKIEYQ